jgi:hypothetical protein
MDGEFDITASTEEKQARDNKVKTGWEQDVAMYSTLDSLDLDSVSCHPFS